MNDHLTILFKVYVFLYVDGKSKMTSTLDKGFNIGKCINIKACNSAGLKIKKNHPTVIPG
jgi:hypothetical protein